MLNHDFRRLYLYYSLPPTLSIIENKIKKNANVFHVLSYGTNVWTKTILDIWMIVTDGMKVQRSFHLLGVLCRNVITPKFINMCRW